MTCPKCGGKLGMVAANIAEWREWVCMRCAINYGTTGPQPSNPGGDERATSDPHQIERWVTDLHAAGWTQVKVTTWRSPTGLLYRGPYGAWKVMMDPKAETTND